MHFGLTRGSSGTEFSKRHKVTSNERVAFLAASSCWRPAVVGGPRVSNPYGQPYLQFGVICPSSTIFGVDDCRSCEWMWLNCPSAKRPQHLPPWWVFHGCTSTCLNPYFCRVSVTEKRAGSSVYFVLSCAILQVICKCYSSHRSSPFYICRTEAVHRHTNTLFPLDAIPYKIGVDDTFEDTH